MRYQQNIEFRLRRVGPKSFLIRSNAAIELSGIAEDVWKRMETPVTPREIAEALARIYDAEPEQIEADVAEFLGVLAAEDAVHSAA